MLKLLFKLALYLSFYKLTPPLFKLLFKLTLALIDSFKQMFSVRCWYLSSISNVSVLQLLNFCGELTSHVQFIILSSPSPQIYFFEGVYRYPSKIGI